ncbi:C40 family peptidase [Maribacter halichondriae]|uniref:C40 family peptidase n=1 Tax=Maribacter halichondriae TaxID=2980554 RepID=UPI002358FC41|nr:C40 family peptidase [Maribacter sp. Hal144]
MQYGICALSIVPIRSATDHSSEMVSQILYGEHFKILVQRKSWSQIRMALDGCEGWVSNEQIFTITEQEYQEIEKSENKKCVSDLVSYIETENNILIPIVLGATINTVTILKHTYEGYSTFSESSKSNLINTALLYLNAPYLWGGRTPFGLDCSGFTQMVYKINGYNLLRKAGEQATQGTALSFIEESEVGDLAFFDNSEGTIDHVGIIMGDNYIIHVYGKVRIDRLDHTGIFNTELGNYTHKLRVIKKIV